MQTDKENLIVQLSFDFALLIVDFTTNLQHIRQFSLANQLFRSGTSIGANIREAQNAESKADFIHKMKIAAKETSETLYWLILCERSESYKFDKKLKEQLDEINRILSKIISSAKGGLGSFIWSALLAFSNFQIFKLTN